jgi:hypothetical protein
MAQIEALHFCYLTTISFKGFRKTPQSSAREAPVTTQKKRSSFAMPGAWSSSSSSSTSRA